MALTTARHRAFRALSGLAFAGSAIAAQAPTAIKLKLAHATHAAEFSRISSIRELSDGRVIVTDSKERRIVVADFRTMQTEPVAQRGAGPGEFTYLGVLIALPGDSAYLTDPISRRWLLLAGTKVVATLSGDTPVIASTRGLIVSADRRNVLAQLFRPAARPSPTAHLTPSGSRASIAPPARPTRSAGCDPSLIAARSRNFRAVPRRCRFHRSAPVSRR